MTIDGTTQCGTPPCVTINGTLAGSDGLVLRGGSSTVRGLIINNFVGVGVRIEDVGGNTIAGNRIGTTAAGTAIRSNDTGIRDQSPGSNTIGGTVVADRNLISGNTSHGIEIVGATLDSVIGNYIGTNAAGTAALANGGNGVNIDGGNQNTVGGGALAQVISGNGNNGVSINGNLNVVRNNIIGLNAATTAAVANTGNGVAITTGDQNRIGDFGTFQLISGNGGAGVQITGALSANTQVNWSYIGTNGTGSGAIPNTGNGVHILGGAHDNIVGLQLNVISGDTLNGVLIEGATTINNVVLKSRIGVTYLGNADLGNGGAGVKISGTGANRIGGDHALDWPTISGNQGNGVSLINTTGVTFLGNYIGTDTTGTADLGNSGTGIYIENSANTQVGAPVAGERNIISGNDGRGIQLTGAGTTGTRIEGAYIGTNAAGTAAIANTGPGISTDTGATTTTIGGTTAGTGNLISGNTGPGIQLQSAGNTVRGNKIGTDVAGTSAISNQYGILIGLTGPGLNNIGGYTPSPPTRSPSTPSTASIFPPRRPIPFAPTPFTATVGWGSETSTEATLDSHRP